MFQTKIYMLDKMHCLIQLKTNKHTSSTRQLHHIKISISSIKISTQKIKRSKPSSPPQVQANSGKQSHFGLNYM